MVELDDELVVVALPDATADDEDVEAAVDGTIAKAKLRVDLPAGKYKVWMIIDHPGGFWGEFPYFTHRTVRAQGHAVIDERMSPEQSKARYFRWQDEEDRESDDLFERYWSKLLVEKTFETAIGSEPLELEFENAGCPDTIPCFGLALSALVIYPVDTGEQRERGERWLARLREERQSDVRARYQMKSKPLTALLAKLPAGFKAWNVPSDTDLSRVAPERVRAFGTDRRESRPFAIRAPFSPRQ